MTPVPNPSTPTRDTSPRIDRRSFLRAMMAGVALGGGPAHAGITSLLNRTLGNQDPQRLAIVLVDVTGSISGTDRALYQRSFDTLLSSNHPGDRMVLAPVSDQPASRFLAHADRTIPLKHKRLEDELALKRTNAALAEDFGQLHPQDGRLAKATCLLDTITATGQLFGQARNQRQELTLLILSDMIEESPAANFARALPDEATAQSLIATRRRQGLLPDLRDVRVYVAGAGGKSAVHMARIQHFWTTFFTITKADLKDYGRSPPVIAR